jgi:hypothetical protein
LARVVPSVIARSCVITSRVSAAFFVLVWWLSSLRMRLEAGGPEWLAVLLFSCFYFSVF